jgi:hydroxymethylpyrimidine/phosphomethylpyrimidine kinase
MSSRPPTVLVIDVSDPTGGSGLETAQRILALQGCYAFTATTALSVQDKQGAYPAIFTYPAFLRLQLETVLKDLEVDVVQVGVLGGSENVKVVADVLRKWQESEINKGKSGCIVMSLVGTLTCWMFGADGNSRSYSHTGEVS